MNAGRAYKIFHDLDNDQYTLEEKAVAIYTIMNMATHNSVRKDAFISACKWLWNQHFTWEQHESEVIK